LTAGSTCTTKRQGLGEPVGAGTRARVYGKHIPKLQTSQAVDPHTALLAQSTSTAVDTTVGMDCDTRAMLRCYWRICYQHSVMPTQSTADQACRHAFY
jgi:hypothetical protein